jgi:hypothetical protein
MSSFQIPWKCLEIASEPITTKIVQENTPKVQKTFAQALNSSNNLCDIPTSQFPQPVVKGDRLAIEIPDFAYQAGLDACKYNLHGRIFWSKGSTPLTVVALKAKLAMIWKDFSQWGVISLGKGYFEFNFSTLEDVRRVRSVPSWNLNPGFLKLFVWTKDFNPRMQHNTSAQVWVRLYGLAQEYWHKTILFTIASSLGTPICIDTITAKPMHERTFGQYARVLVDMDLSQTLRYNVLVERKGFAFFVDIEYENLPDFCSECHIIGHHVDNCKKVSRKEGPVKEILVQKNTTDKGGVTRKAYVQTNDGRSQHKANEVINVEKETINVEDSKEGSSHGKTMDQGFEIDSQTHSTPPCNTPRPAYKELTVLSPKGIPAANAPSSDQDNNAGNMDKQLLVIVDQQDSDSDESFVNATQNLGHADTQFPVNKLTNERILNDMNFLKESWANMVEEDDVTQQDLEIANNTEMLQDDGFQVAMSKQQRKIQKKKSQSGKDSYVTRSKVSSKPFR